MPGGLRFVLTVRNRNMIILTQPGITKLVDPTKISSTVKCGGDYCLAVVPDDFDANEEQMAVVGLDFWYEVTASQLSAEEYKLRKYDGGIIEGIMEQLSLSKERNLAYAIYAIAADRVADEFQVWERSIKKQ